MGNDSIDKVLESRKQIVAMPSPDGPEHTFYSVLGADGLNENYLELKMRDGLRICLSYTDLMWFSYDPEGPKIDLEFGGIFVTIKGRGLGDALFNGIKQKRLAWVKEADTEMEDHPGNAMFIEEITFLTKQEDTAPAE